MANADIETPADFVQAHPQFPLLLANPAVVAAFKVQERAANSAKFIYTLLGQYGLFAAFLSFTALIYIVTLEHWLYDGPKLLAPSEHMAFKIVFFVVGATGVAAQVFLLGGPLKRQWLNARFQAERLRSIKFQAFQAAACGGDHAVSAFTDRALGDLSIEASDATAARHNFQSDRALIKHDGTPSVGGEDLKQLRRAYRRLRVDRQSAFAIGEIKRIGEERKLPTSSSELAFWLGACFAYADAILTFVDVHWEPLRPIMHFVTLELFVVSALVFVLERGRSYELALERYEDYREQMLHLADRLDHAATAQELVDCVKEGEKHALRELRSFCREAERSTYLI